MSTNTEDVSANAHLKNKSTPLGANSTVHPTANRRSSSKRIADLLFDHDLIGPSTQYPRTTIRYITLNPTVLFTQLVNLYTVWFQARWDYFQAFAKLNGLSQELSSAVLFVRYYISAWFLDLYSTIRESVQKVDNQSYITHYSTDRPRSGHIYDHFLSRLNASIRPTQIHLIMRTSLFVPVLRYDERSRHSNPFGIRHFSYRPDIVKGINEIMSSRNLCTTTPLSTDPTGSPAWLFDFHVVHGLTNIYAWFPQEHNFCDEDITVAFILGDSCTPHLGPVQYDEWQWYPNYLKTGITIDPYSVRRVNPRTTHGNAEVTVIEDQQLVFPDYYATDPRVLRANVVGPLAYPYNARDFPVPMEEVEVDAPVAPAAAHIEESSSSALALTSPQAEEEDSDAARAKRARTETSKVKIMRQTRANIPSQIKVDRFRILVYVYHSKVAVKVFQTTRNACLNQYLSV